ncbi:hypothetical protein [Avibacterium volantium]|nr:hypothetical protein [Avibacterium volantium]
MAQTPMPTVESKSQTQQANNKQVDKKQLDKLQYILNISQDADLLAKYSKRKQPVYQVENREAIKLETIRSTKISTFLIFLPDVNTAQYEIKGKFQDIVKLDNIVAILHRQKQPPSHIKIIAPNGTAVLTKIN